MQSKNINASEFLESLNMLSKSEGRPLFGIHKPNGNEALAYAYTYVSTEKQARELSAWLLNLGVESEILYVDKKKQFIINIPFVNTYYKDYLEKKERPEALVTIKTLLADAVNQVGLEWAAKCSQLSKVIETYFALFQENRKIRKGDLVQTTLFKLGVNYANNSIIDAVVDHEIDFKPMVIQVENFISHLKLFDREKTSLNRSLTSAAKIRGGLTDNARLEFARLWISFENRFFLLCTTNLSTATEIYKLDNFLYQQWLFINKQIESVSFDQKKLVYLEAWQNIKLRCISAAKCSREILAKMPRNLYMDGIGHYIAQFLNYEAGEYKGDNKKIIDQEKSHVDDVVRENERNIRDIREKYEGLKAEVNQLAREVFMSSNQGPKPKVEVDESKIDTLKK